MFTFISQNTLFYQAGMRQTTSNRGPVRHGMMTKEAATKTRRGM
jgi:hypothetical protein